MSKVQDLKNNDQTAFNEVFSCYHQQLYNYVLNRTGSSYYAEEVVQVSFIKLWKNRQKLSEEVELHIQLFRIAKTSLIDELRKNKNKYKISLLIQKDNKSNAANETYNNIAFNETNSKLQQLVASMPPVRRKIFEMSRYKEMSHKEISEELQIALKTVENHINLALKYIKPFFTYLLFYWILK